MPAKKSTSSSQSPRRAPASTPEARQLQMVNLADQLAEKQLREGTATSQVMIHYLRLGTAREELELEKLKKENQLREAQIEQLASAQRMESLFEEAIRAFRGYHGDDVED